MSRWLSEHEREKLAGEIAALQSVDVTQLKTRWRTLYGSEAPSRFSRDLLMRAVAYRMQERALGGLTPTTRRLFQRVAADAHARRPPKMVPLGTPQPGAILIREWNVVKYKVVAREDGFSFRGQHYRSLSAVARLITGSRWSGPLFFGLKHRTKARVDDWSPLNTRYAAAQFTPVNLQTRGWSRTSIRWLLSARPAKPSSVARRVRVGG